MALSSGFFNGVDRKYDAIQISSLFDGLINDGVFSTIGNRFVVNVASANSVTIGTGRAWFKHTWTYNDTPYPVQMDAAEAILNRYDILALEMDLVTGRANGIKYIKGTPSSSAVEPLLIQNSSIYQVPLAVAYRKAGATTLTQADITQKVGTSSCPLVTAVNQSMTIDSIVAQWETEFDNWMVTEQTSFGSWKTTQQSAFTTWFDTIKNQLTDNVAGSLQNQINSINSQLGSDYMLSYLTIPSVSGNIVTVFSDTKFIMADGKNTDGTIKQTLNTILVNKSLSITYDLVGFLFVESNGSLLPVAVSNFGVSNTKTALPSTVSSTSRFVYYVRNDACYYYTEGSTTANWTKRVLCRIASFEVVSGSFINFSLFYQNNVGKKVGEERVIQALDLITKNTIPDMVASAIAVRSLSSLIGSDFIVSYITAPYVSGNTFVIATQTQFVCAEGKNTDNTIRQVIRTLDTVKTRSSFSGSGCQILFLLSDMSLISAHAMYTKIVDSITDLPTTVASSSERYIYFVRRENRYYNTCGSTTASWRAQTCCKIATVFYENSSIYKVVINYQNNLTHKIDESQVVHTMAEIQKTGSEILIPSTSAIKEISNYIVQSRHSLPASGNIVESWWFDKWYDGHCTANLVLKTSFEPGIAWILGQYHLSSVFSLPFPLKHVRAVGIHQNEDVIGMHVGTRWFKDANSVSKRMQFYINNSNSSAIPWESAGAWVIAIEGIWRELVNGQWVEVTGGA